MAWRALLGTGYGLAMYSMVYGMAWQCMAWYTVRPGGHGMVYGMVYMALCMAWYIWHCGHGMVYARPGGHRIWYMVWPI